MYQSRNYLDLNSQSSILNKSAADFTDVKKQAFTILYIFMLILIGLSILLYISQILNINQKSSRLLELESKLEQIRSQNERLEIKLSSKTSLAEVEKIAKNKLNMVEPKNKETLVYNKQLPAEKYVADIPKEKFFLAQIYDKIIREVVTVQAESLE